VTTLTRVLSISIAVLAIVSVAIGEWAAFMMGALQGITEFLPISSSAHLILLPWLFAWDNDLLHSLTFDVGLHVGTLAAVLFYFRDDLLSLVKATPQLLRGVRNQQTQLIVAIVVGTLPAAVLGVLFESVIEEYLRSPIQIAVVLAIMGIVIAYADRVGQTHRELTQLGWRDAVWIGLAQACALVPGVSRSGATMSAARVLGFDRNAAARFAFLLSTPITLAAVAVKADDLLLIQGSDVVTMLVGVVTAAVVGVVVIDLLLSWIRRIGLGVFAYYRWVVAIAVIVVWYLRG
jgi:undecaprenyl-diphosphatase